MSSASGMFYMPESKPIPVVKEGEFVISAIGLDHGHIFGMTKGLMEAGATLKWVYDPDPKKLDQFCEMFPQAKRARSQDEVLLDKEVQLIASAAVASERCGLGLLSMDAGKDYFADKAPLTSLNQLAAAKDKVSKTGKKYAVYYSERTHVETAVFAEQLIEQGAIGRVLQVISIAPHRIGALSGRPDWFFEKEKYGGILCDIGSHQIDQVLYYTGSTDGKVVNSQIANYNHPDYPELDDFGDANLVMENGSTGYIRVDWFTPDGLQSWGDGRCFILGTEGFIEQRKYLNLGTKDGPGHLFLCNQKEETHYNVSGKIGYPFFGRLILDCLNRTENAMTQVHAFKAAELSIKAQMGAVMLENVGINK